MEIDYSEYLSDIVDKLDLIISLLKNLNSFLYVLIFGLAGIGIIVLLYRFLKIFI